jgi:hypothetical protein
VAENQWTPRPVSWIENELAETPRQTCTVNVVKSPVMIKRIDQVPEMAIFFVVRMVKRIADDVLLAG